MTPTRGTRVYRRVVGTTPCAYTVWDEVDTNGGTPGVVWGVDEAEAMERALHWARERLLNPNGDHARAYRSFARAVGDLTALDARGDTDA